MKKKYYTNINRLKFLVRKRRRDILLVKSNFNINYNR